MKKRRPFYLVHDDDLIGVLETLGILADVKRNKLKCPFCSEVANFETIGAIYPEGNEIKIACDKPSCLTQLAAIRSGQCGDNETASELKPVRESETVSEPVSNRVAMHVTTGV